MQMEHKGVPKRRHIKFRRQGITQKETCNIIWFDRVEDGLSYRGQEERNILHSITRKKANWVGHIWHRNCLIKLFTEGKIEGRI